MELKDKKCLACEGEILQLALEEKKKLLTEIGPYWNLTYEASRLERKFKFKSFKKALEFTNKVGMISEEENHHPEIHLGLGHCDIEIWTHRINNLVENDFILAAKINEIYSRLFPDL